MKNPIKVLVLAGLILAVVASSTGFAATWSGKDYSTLCSGPSVSWTEQISNTPLVSYGTGITWDNTYKNNYGSNYYPTVFAADRIGNWWKYPEDNYLSYGQTSSKTGNAVAFEQGTSCPIDVTHRYGTSRDSNQYSSTTTMTYKTS